MAPRNPWLDAGPPAMGTLPFGFLIFLMLANAVIRSIIMVIVGLCRALCPDVT